MRHTCAVHAWVRSAVSTLGICAALVVSIAGHAATDKAGKPLVLESDGDDAHALEPYMTVLTVPTDDMEIDEARVAAARGEFEPLPTTGANFGFTDQTVWLRFTLEPRRDGRFVVEIPYPNLSRVILHAPEAPNAEQRLQRAGDRRPFGVRPLRYRLPAFPLELNRGDTVTVYLEVASSRGVLAPARIWADEAFYHAVRRSAYVLGPYYGVLCAMVVYNLLLFLLVRDRTTLYYVAAIASIGVFVFSYTGLAFELLWPNAPAWNEMASALIACIGTIAVLQFSRSFLDLSSTVPRGDLLLRALIAISALLAIATFVLPAQPAATSATLAAFVSSVFILAVSVVAWLRGGRRTLYFLVGWGVCLAGVVITVLTLRGFLPANVFTRNALPVGSAIEMIVLGIAVADRLRLLREEKERIQADTMRRLVRELHDGMGRHFVRLMRSLDRGTTPHSHLRTDVRRAFVDMRLLVASAQVPFSDLASGLSTIREQYDPLLEDYGMQWDWHVEVPAGCLAGAPERLLDALRIVQEALTNAIKYSGATVLRVEAKETSQGGAMVTLSDNGDGAMECKGNGGGMAHMWQRASESGIELEVSGETRTIRLVIEPQPG